MRIAWVVPSRFEICVPWFGGETDTMAGRVDPVSYRMSIRLADFVLKESLKSEY